RAAGGTPVPPPTPQGHAKACRPPPHSPFPRPEKVSAFPRPPGPPRGDALTEASRSKDPEVSRRARKVLEKFKWGIYPDTPRDVLDLIEKFRSGDLDGKQAILKALLEKGAVGRRTLARLLASEDAGDNRQKLWQHVEKDVAHLAPDLLKKKQFPELEELLEIGLAAETETGLRSYAVYYFLRGRLDEAVKRWRPRAEQPDGARAAAVLIYLYRLKG